MNKYENTIELIVRLLIKKENKVLLCFNKETNSHFLPGGHVEFGDTFEETIYKETFEELGWKNEDIKNISFKTYLENSYISDNEKHQELNMIFDVEIDKNTPINSKEDHISFEWIELSSFDSLKILPKAIIQFIA